MVLFRDGIQALTKRYDMCLVGSDGVGKSTLIVHYIYDRFIPDIEDLDALYTKRVVTPDTGEVFKRYQYLKVIIIKIYTVKVERCIFLMPIH